MGLVYLQVFFLFHWGMFINYRNQFWFKILICWIYIITLVNNWFKFFCSKSFEKMFWSKFLKILYSTNFLFILGIVPLIWTDIMLWTSLKPQLKFCIFWQRVDRFVKITSLRVAGAPLVKQVGLLTRFTKSKISHTFFSGAPHSQKW